MYVNVLKMVPQSYATVKNTTGYKILTERNLNISLVMPPKLFYPRNIKKIVTELFDII